MLSIHCQEVSYIEECLKVRQYQEIIPHNPAVSITADSQEQSIP